MNYVCPYCNQPTTLTSPNYDDGWESINIAAEYLKYTHRLGLRYHAVACPNKKCKQLGFSLTLTSATNVTYNSDETNKRVYHWELLPESSAKPQPDYIPKPIVEDYTEACRIKSLSSKASAALARRCMQGMVRDFHGIIGDTLYNEISLLKGDIPLAEWKALDSLRKIGNIGAHMEENVNLIIDIDPEEAEKLIAFIEYLFRQWYVKRHDDEENLAEIQKIAGLKQAAKKKTVLPKPTK